MTDQINNQPATPADNEQVFTEQWRETWEANRAAKQYMRATLAEVVRANALGLPTTYLYIAETFLDLPKDDHFNFILSHCKFNGCDFMHSDLLHCNFTKADLNGCDFSGCNLRSAIFYGASLENSNFSDADLRHIDFKKADTEGVIGLKILAPIGEYGRLIYAYTFKGEIQIQAGCFNGTPDEVRQAIVDKYSGLSRLTSEQYMDDYLAAVGYLEQWGKTELKRLGYPKS